MTSVHPPLLSAIGLGSLALGALSGWLVTAVTERPDWFVRRGIPSPGRFRQAHLDWIMMGLVLVAVDQAAPHRPGLITALIAAGTVVNPLLFLPLAWGTAQKERPLYRLITVLSFASLSIGLTALFFDAVL